MDATRRDRDGEEGARRKQLRDCGAQQPTPDPPPPLEQCHVSVVLRNGACLNADGSSSSLVPGASSVAGCGANLENARIRARLNFAASFGCISDGDMPAPGCCTVDEQTVSGCICR